MPARSVPDDRTRWVALLVLCAGMLMMILDQTIVNVALPSIQRDLDVDQADLAWVVNGYLVAFGGLLLLAGRLGDLLGRRRVFLVGLTVFTVASLLCAVAVDLPTLVAARFLQGVGGALTASVILGMIATLFPDPSERARAIGVFSFTAAAGGSIGLLLGGTIVELTSWHGIFLVNVPVGAAAIVVAMRTLAPDRGLGLRAGADLTGAVLVTSSLMLGVSSIIGAERRGWTAPATLGGGVVAVVLLGLFVARQRTATTPLVPLRIFRSRTTSGANAVHALMVSALFGFQFLGGLYLQQVLGYGPAQVGLSFLPVALAIAVFSLGVTARLLARYGGRTVLVPGLLLLVVGLLLMGRSPADGRYVVDVLPFMLALGVGAGLAIPTLMTLAMADATDADAGLASGLVNTAEQVGGALGLAVAATLASSRAAELVADGTDRRLALLEGYHLAFHVGVGIVLAALVLALVVLPRRPPRPTAPAEPPVAADRQPEGCPT